MKILMAHNRYLESGGEDISFRMEVEMLRRNGCEVATYEEDNRRVQKLGGLRTALRSVWSWETFRKVRSILRETRYDVLHVQNFFPLISPSIYYAAKAEGVPVVQSLRNYRLLCPQGTLNRDGRVCEACVGRAFSWPAVRHRCYKDSMVASGVVASMLSVNGALGTWAKLVDAYIALTENMRDRFVQAGLPAHKVFVKSNFLHPAPAACGGDGAFALFAGRLTPEKGVETLLKAWELVDGAPPLRIAGSGPLQERIAADGRSGPIDFLGWRPEKEVLALMGSARFVVIPTQWYEGQPRTAIEAFSVGAPIIASNIGAMSEMIEDGETGLLFEPGNAADLAAKVRWALENGDEMRDLGARGRLEFERKYTAEQNFRTLMDIYERIAGPRKERALQTAAGCPPRPANAQ